jgi:hypothetical protein
VSDGPCIIDLSKTPLAAVWTTTEQAAPGDAHSCAERRQAVPDLSRDLSRHVGEPRASEDSGGEDRKCASPAPARLCRRAFGAASAAICGADHMLRSAPCCEAALWGSCPGHPVHGALLVGPACRPLHGRRAPTCHPPIDAIPGVPVRHCLLIKRAMPCQRLCFYAQPSKPAKFF